MASTSTTLDQLEQEIESEFIDETRDVLSGLEVMLGNFESGLVDAPQALATLRRAFRSLEARSQSLDKASLSIVSRRAFEFLSDLQTMVRERVTDVQVFIDVSRKLLDRTTAEHARELVRQLPSRRIVDFNVAEAIRTLDIEMLVVIPDRATSRYVERELAACGYRVSNAGDFFKALELAVRTQPDMVITTAVLDEEASGIDLVRALSVIAPTAKMPVALLTSYALDHPSLADLPDSAAVIRKGGEFGEDLANALSRFKIT